MQTYIGRDRLTTIAWTAVVTEEQTPNTIPIEEAEIFSADTPKKNPTHTKPTAESVAVEDRVPSNTKENPTVKGSTKPRAI